MKRVLGLDIGTNSIGAALLNIPEKFENYGKDGSIVWAGSRIIPTDGDYLKKYEEGQSSGVETKAAARRSKRGARRLKHRYKLRRTRLIKVLKALGWIDENFPLDDPKLFKNKTKNDSSYKFSISSYLPFSEETITEFKTEMGIINKKRFDKKKNKEVDYLLPEDWVIYYLRKKALTQRIEIPELVRIIYMMNQRRGFKSSRKDLKGSNVLTYKEFIERKERKDYGENGIETQFASITKIKSVTFKEEKDAQKGNKINVYTIIAEDSRIESWEEKRKKQPDWEGKEVTFLVIQKIDKNGKLSQNKPQIPEEDNWSLCTTALDEKINEQTYPGKYFFDELKKAFHENRNFKIRQYPVYRWRYKKELEDIWKKQCELNPEVQKINSDKNLLLKLAEILYPTQAKYSMPKLAELRNSDLITIISNDIVYYQRELKSQKNSISECRYEKRRGIDGEIYGLKCIPRSSPIFQEFRIWQDIHNIRILLKELKEEGKTYLDVDMTQNIINEPIKEKLFELFNSKLSVSEKNILELIKENSPNNNIFIDIDKNSKEGKNNSHRINLYSNRNELKGNETLNRYRLLFKKAEFDGEDILGDTHKLQKLWHIDYSITSSDEETSRKGITTALNNFIEDKPNKNKVIQLFCKLPELKKEYGSYSAMAIKKMLPIMRCGRYWKETDILENLKERAGQISERLSDINYNTRRISEIADDDIQKQVLKSFIGKNNLTKELGTYQACYLIYDRHSEKITPVINSIEDFGSFIQKEIPTNSLRNPIVEKAVRETMFLVRDIWKKYGIINEIHIEIGRDLKKNTEERKRITEIQKNNFDEKQRIKQLLYELLNEGFDQYIDTENSTPTNWETEIESNKEFEVKPNPENPGDIDKFKIWKSLSKATDVDWEKKVKDEKIPTESQVKKYVLWLSQNCRSPYTGKIIPLSKLFDITQYEIEHIIPRRKLKNDSTSNLVIAEWGVNKAKGSELAASFISQSNGKCFYGDKEYRLLTYAEYDAYCKETFRFQQSKRKNLLAIDVPEDFVERQLNDTRYIGKKLSQLLSPVAKNKDGSLNENGILFTIGNITSELKNNWGLSAIWKEIIRPRFERLEKITGRQFIFPDENDSTKYHFDLRENPKLELKRIDHRHHALDALIIAATTREHIRYLNTLNASDTDDEFKKYRLTLVKGKIRDFKQPWDGFTKECKKVLEETIVTFKSSSNIISKPNNKYLHGFNENGKPIKCEQKDTPRWMAVRKSMFKLPQGVIYLKEIEEEKNILKAIEIHIDRMSVQNTAAMGLAAYVYDQEARKIIKDLIERIGISTKEKDVLISEIKKYLQKNKLTDFAGKQYNSIKIAKFHEYATKRVKLDKTFDRKKIDKIPYAKIGKSILANLLYKHLDSIEYGGKPELAFSGEGLESLAKKVGKPVTKVTIAEKKDSSSKLGKQYVEVDAGAIAYFIMYEHQLTKVREGFASIATHKAIERLNDKTKKGIADQKEGYDLIILSPGDLVYVPTLIEREKIKQSLSLEEAIAWKNINHLSKGIYRMIKATDSECHFVPYQCVNNKPIIENEFGANNCSEKAWDGLIIYKENNKGKLTRTDSGTRIKDFCIKLKVDRLGNISPFHF